VNDEFLPAKPRLDRDSPLRLLLIEDSASDSELIRALLEEELPQAKIDVAASLEDALVRLGRDRFDATLADLSLPDADGLSVVRKVRSAHPETALLVLTGRADGVLDLWSLAEGAQDYLVKGRDDGPRLVTALLYIRERRAARCLPRGQQLLSRVRPGQPC
jgi:DNA-binding response OmpR family regulator